MLTKLKIDNHRVLIFSQMTQMLDVLEDFLDAEGYKFERIDGSITGSLRQEAIDRFNAPGAQQFVFLLSTRAGGLGINLASADTVIIYDSDWNPHNDIQALSRAHRIGQTNKVMIYRFVTRNSVEERITQVAKKKMMLTHLVVRPGLGSKTTNTTMSKQELDDILKFGTEELFKEEEGKESDAAIHYDDKAIEDLLDRSNEGIEEKEVWAEEYMSSFKVASYATKEAEEEEEEVEQAPAKPAKEEAQQDPHYWEKLLGIHYIQYQDNISRSLGKGKRVRKQVNYMDSASGQNEYHNPDTSESSDFSMPSGMFCCGLLGSNCSLICHLFKDLSEGDEDFDERAEGGRGGNQKQLRKGTKEKMPPLISAIGPNTEVRAYFRFICVCGILILCISQVLGFTPKHRKLFLDLVMRFGLPNLEQSISDSQFFVRELKNKPEKHLRAYASLFISHLCEPGDPSATTFEDGVPKEGINVGQVLTRIGIISLIKRKVFEYQEKHGLFSFKVVKKPVVPAVVAGTSASEESTKEPELIELKDEENGTEVIANETTAAAAAESADKEAKKDETDEEKPAATTIKDESMEVDGEIKEEKTVDSAKGSEAKEKTADVEEKMETEEESKEVQVKADLEEESKDASTVATSTPDETSQQSTTKSETSTSMKEEDSSAPATNGTIEETTEEKPEVKPEEVEEEVTEVKEFEFNIQDGGLTELHTLWYFEEKELKPRREHEIWNRRHDYWLLVGVAKHGYEQWDQIGSDEDYAIVNEPFKATLALRNKFMERRLRLLEQALVFEEQIRRYTHLASAEAYIEKPKEVPEKKPEEGQENGDADKEEEGAEKKENGDVKEDKEEEKKENGDLAEGDDKENEAELILNPNIQRAANQLEDLLIDMKSDCARIPQTVQRIPSIANRLQIGTPRGVNPMAGMPQSMLSRLI